MNNTLQPNRFTITCIHSLNRFRETTKAITTCDGTITLSDGTGNGRDDENAVQSVSDSCEEIQLTSQRPAVEGKTLRSQIARVLRVLRPMTGVVHLQHAIPLADRTQDKVVVHHHNRGVDGIPPILVTPEEDAAVLEELFGENDGSALHVLEGVDERALVGLVTVLDVVERVLDELEREGGGLHVEESRADALVSLEYGGIEGRGLDERDGILVDDDVGVGVEHVDAETQNGLDDGELEGGDLVEGGGGLFDEGGGDGVCLHVVEGDGDVHGLEELEMRGGRSEDGIGGFVLCDDEEGMVLCEIAVLVEVDGEETIGIGCDGNEHGVLFLSLTDDIFEAVHGFGSWLYSRYSWYSC